MVNVRNASRPDSTGEAPRPPVILAANRLLSLPFWLGETRPLPIPVVLRPVFARFHKLTAGARWHDRVRATQQPSREKATDMAAAPICMSCNLERTLVSVQPARNRHDVRQYECPKCGSPFRLVVPREPLDKVVDDAPPLQAGAR
jgi:hypothetical protein